MADKKQRRSMISVRGGYSDKHNMGSVSNAIQIKEFDDRTRTILSNKTRGLLEDLFEKDLGFRYFMDTHSLPHEFCMNILSNVFLVKIDISESQIYIWRSVYDNHIYPVITQAPYNEVLDIIWYISNWFVQKNRNFKELMKIFFNSIFEEECVGYRFVNGEIVPITDKQEIEELEEVVQSEFKGCSAHIAKAISLLSDRTNKDYKNCVKESISAVESICKIIVGKNNAQLGDMLKILESKRGLKGPLKAGFEKLYNYTNDKGGIRHAEGLFVSNVTFEEAKFMLVSCSAFVNYLIAEYGKIKGE